MGIPCSVETRFDFKRCQNFLRGIFEYVRQKVAKRYTSSKAYGSKKGLPIRLPHNLRILSGFFGLQYHRPVGTLRQRGVRQVLAMSEMTSIDRSDD